MKALAKFVQECDYQLLEETDDLIERNYRFKVPQEKSFVKVNLTTMPEFSQDLEKMWGENETSNDLKDEPEDDWDDEWDDESRKNSFVFDRELIPKGTLISLTSINHNELTAFENKSYDYQKIEVIQSKNKQKDLPVIILQTTRPKANRLIEKFKSERGIAFIGLPMSHDQYNNPEYGFGILETEEDNLYMFSKYFNNAIITSSVEAINKWHRSVNEFDGFCGVIIAMGATGVSRGNPSLKDLLYLFNSQITDQYQINLHDS